MDEEILTEITEINKNHVDWTVEHEQILIEWADKAMCYRWLHDKSYNQFSRLNAWYTIPVIIISTLTGTANFAQERVPITFQTYFVIMVGSFNILAGIITTIQQFLKITQLSEAHRVSSIAWDKFYRNIKIELAKHPSERMDVKQMLKINKEEFDRLIETSPNIPENIIIEFKSHFSDNEDFLKIIKPEICDVLLPTNNFRNQWYNDENTKKMVYEEIKTKLVKEYKQRKITEQNIKVVTDFVSVFVSLNNRKPLESEVIDNLKDRISIEIIKKIIDNYNILNSESIKNKDDDENTEYSAV